MFKRIHREFHGWLVAIIVACIITPLAAEQPTTKLFDGTTLKGWRGDASYWSVRNGAIVGNTKPNGRQANTFLIADGDYHDFVLRVKFKLINGASGVQFRSRPLGDPAEFHVTGYQADIGSGDTGTFYEEKGRSTLAAADAEVVRRHYKPGKWNQYEISAIGDDVVVKVNGHVTARYTETEPASKIPRAGFVALQLQAGVGMEIAFKDISIRPVNPTTAESTDSQPPFAPTSSDPKAASTLSR